MHARGNMSAARQSVCGRVWAARAPARGERGDDLGRIEPLEGRGHTRKEVEGVGRLERVRVPIYRQALVARVGSKRRNKFTFTEEKDSAK